ncbi:ABC transporter substrate-binding protein [Pararhizobium mangrovi]|uniref:ABC transporter substrate-binding protein n=1 Tax=Pararhizobium mangrovi TaxID=2590452 RepID=A0A506UAX4_9HYPH|nr:ABC transporter substrate-binding protein [Pararhizobium mangrovi]TPW28957.1 ABC transporter substrate-binding protein [Pararhizobium mangrovi]
MVDGVHRKGERAAGVPLRRRSLLKGFAGVAGAALAGSLVTPAKADTARVSADVAPFDGDLTRRVLLGDGHALLALALIHPDPVSLLAGWQGDLKRHSTVIYAQYAERFPAIADVPVVGEASPDTFSIEAALATDPAVAILAGSYGPGPEDTHVVERLEAAGIRVVFVDFYAKPLENTAPSMRALGRLFGGEVEEKAEAFAAFHEERLARVRKRLAAEAPARPSVLLQAHSGAQGWDCCYVPGRAGLGEFIDAAGGANIGDALSDNRPWVRTGLEYVLAQDPDLVVATGGPYLAGTGGPVIGPGVSQDEARASLAAALQSAEIGVLPAVRDGRAFGLWHLLQATPLNAIALEALARWQHPALFADIDPQATMAEINTRFLAVPLEGCFAVSLEGVRKR